MPKIEQAFCESMGGVWDVLEVGHVTKEGLNDFCAF